VLKPKLTIDLSDNSASESFLPDYTASHTSRQQCL